jgi:hypothetical protein
MVVGALVVPRIGGLNRLILGTVLYSTSWVMVSWWIPRTWNEVLLKEIVFGALDGEVFRWGSFPLLPWTAIFIASSVLGEHLAQLLAQGFVRRAARQLGSLGASGVTLTALTKLVAFQAGLSPMWGRVASPLLRVGQKHPPGPLYLLFFGGIGLLILCGCLLAEHEHWFRRVTMYAAHWGEASFFIFIAQFFVYWDAIYSLGPGGPASGLLYFLCSLALLVYLGAVWRRHRGNRLLTVGYGALWLRLSRA